jgi:perosamine synthetase
MKERIPMASADLDDTDIEAVLDVLRTGRLALGPKIIEFERAMADYIGTRHAVAVNSGTAALHLIVKALAIGAGDEVLVPSFTFAASVNAFLYEGATPVFVEIERDTYNLDPADLEQRITPRTRAIMAVDVFGHPADWEQLQRIAEHHGLKIIDDSCEALGASYKGVKLGRFGSGAAFAFYPNKQMTTGEGGIIVTDDDRMAGLCRSLANQGRGQMGAWLEHERLGYNYRIDEMSAALGVSQLRRLDEFLMKRASVARRYSERLARFDWVRPPLVKADVRMSWFVYVVTLADGLDRDAVMRQMEARGVPVRGYFSPVHLQPYIRERFDGASGALPITESIARRTIALPFHNNLSDAHIEEVVATLAEVIEQAQGKMMNDE